MGGVPRDKAVALAESVRDFIHAVDEAIKMGTPLDKSVNLAMISRSRAAIKNFEEYNRDTKQEGGE